MNQAYISGNAIFIRNTQRQSNPNKFCAGVTISNSVFERNVGMRRSNGGGISVVCQFLNSLKHEDYYKTSAFNPPLTLGNLKKAVI